jgi:Na+-driven multidrug efflux pump
MLGHAKGSRRDGEQNRILFESMPIPRALATLAIPTVISQLILLVYNLADTYFIGRTGNPYMVAAASLVFPFYNISIAFANLFGTGGGSLISRLLGLRKEEEAKKVCAFSFWCAIASAALFSAVTLIFMTPILNLLGASENTFVYASQYAFFTIVVGGIPTILSISMAILMRSIGCAAEASFGTSMGCLLNIGLDPLFMFVILPPGMEVAGAAFATMLSNAAAMVYFIMKFAALRKTTVLSLSPRQGMPAGPSVASVFAVGVPSALTTFLYDATNIVIDMLSATHGDVAVAAIGIVLKAERVPLNTGVGICQAMMPIAGYNYSSGNYRRMRSVLNFSRLCGIAVSVLCIILYEIFAGRIMQLFIDSPETIALGTDFIRVRCLASIMMFLCFNFVFFFEAIGMGRISLFLAVIRQIVFNMPLLFLMNYLYGMYGIIWTQLIADACTACVSFIVYSIVGKKRLRPAGAG